MPINNQNMVLFTLSPTVLPPMATDQAKICPDVDVKPIGSCSSQFYSVVLAGNERHNECD